MGLEALEDRLLLSADQVLDWNAVALNAVAADHTPSIVPVAEQGGPTRTSRALAIVHAAIFDAVNSIDGSYAPYLVSQGGPQDASIEAAVAQAAHDTLVALYPHQTATFDAALALSLADIADGPAEDEGIAVGQSVASQILNARQNDGSATDPPYTPGTLPGDHQEDPHHPGQGFLTPGWGNVTPFAMTSGSQFRADPPPALTSKAYVKAFNEVKSLGGDGINTPTRRTPEQTVIGIFWGYDGSPGLGTPPRLYNQIARTIAIQQGNSEVQNARLFALVNIAMADVGIAVWDTKYVYNFWRPILGIQQADSDGNPRTKVDPNWTYLGAPCSNGCGAGTNFTPPFPAYTSGHAGFGAAAFRTLRDFYGTDKIPFSFTSDEFNGVTTDENGLTRPVVTRSFKRLSQAAEENAQSRIYLGIHWRFDKTQGIAQGTAVADYIFRNFLQPLTNQPCPADSSGSSSTAHGEHARTGRNNIIVVGAVADATSALTPSPTQLIAEASFQQAFDRPGSVGLDDSVGARASVATRAILTSPFGTVVIAPERAEHDRTRQLGDSRDIDRLLGFGSLETA